MKKILFIVFVFTTVSVFAGGWTQKKGSGYFKIGSQVIIADRFHEPGGRIINITTLGDYTIGFYGEYGITDGLTIYTSVPFFRRLTLNKLVGKESGTEYFEGDSKTGIGDASVGVRFALFNFGSTVISGNFMLGLPIGDNTQKNGLYTGDGELNQMFALELGHSFYPAPFYAAAKLGYNNRVKGYSDEIRYLLEFGYNLTKDLLIIVRATGIEPLRNGLDNVTGGAGGLFANNQQYLAYGPEINYSFLKDFGVSAGFKTAARAENVVAALAYTFGVYYKL